MRRNPRISVTATLVIVIVVGTIAYLVGTGRQPAPASQASNQTAAATDMSSHHSGQAKGAYTNLNALVGSPAPDFSLADRDGKIYTRDGLKGKNVVLFFNEGLMCYPSCWNQIVALAQDKRFSPDDTVVLSIVVDAPAEWQRAINKMPTLGEATVLFDKGGALSQALGITKTESSMHYGQYPGHSYLVIDTEGVVRHALDDPKMGIHNDQILEEVKKLAAS